MVSGEEVPSSINVSLILQNLGNQALIGYTILLGGSGYAVLTQRAHVDPGALILGVAGVVPMLVLSREIETSESPYVSGLNLSTNMAVLNLFGPQARPALAGLISLVLATVTGIVEETVFRGQSLPAFANAYGGGDVFTGVVLSTLLFAILHTNPLAFFKGKEAVADNLTLLTLQIINGSIFALLYILSGNLAVPILTHALYDFYTFYKTHLVDVAGQMEYAEREAAMPFCSSNKIEQMWIEERGEEWLTDTKQSFYLMDTNMDGAISRKELRIALYSYGVYLSEEESEEVKLAADKDNSGEIDFDEYLEFVGPTGSRFKAVKYALLGPA